MFEGDLKEQCCQYLNNDFGNLPSLCLILQPGEMSKKNPRGLISFRYFAKKTSYECFYSNAEDKPSNSKEEVFHPYILTIFLYSRMVIEFSDLYAGNHKNA